MGTVGWRAGSVVIQGAGYDGLAGGKCGDTGGWLVMVDWWAGSVVIQRAMYSEMC